ncbi:hypothetical protein tb265_04460 [Gemmatimonadetes bacterium T265]|nr:hypothetical protein tb265_04460 [Gemmatimonadetes bacterium T265]
MTAPRADSPSSSAPRARPRADSDDRRFQDDHFRDASRPPRTRAEAKHTLLDTIRQLPAYLRLLGGLLLDARVSTLDKALVAGAMAYVISPIDLIPDFIPFIGEVDDVFVMMLALQRLVANAGHDVLLDHWHGDPDELHELNVKEVLGAAVLFLPGGVRTKLVGMVRRGMGRPSRR